MDKHFQKISLSALDAAATALLGQYGANVLAELYKVIDAAERRGFEEGYSVGENAGHRAGFDVGFDIATRFGDADYADLVVENRSPQPLTDEEIHDALDEAFATGVLGG